MPLGSCKETASLRLTDRLSTRVPSALSTIKLPSLGDISFCWPKLLNSTNLDCGAMLEGSVELSKGVVEAAVDGFLLRLLTQVVIAHQ